MVLIMALAGIMVPMTAMVLMMYIPVTIWPQTLRDPLVPKGLFEPESSSFHDAVDGAK